MSSKTFVQETELSFAIFQTGFYKVLQAKAKEHGEAFTTIQLTLEHYYAFKNRIQKFNAAHNQLKTSLAGFGFGFKTKTPVSSLEVQEALRKPVSVDCSLIDRVDFFARENTLCRILNCEMGSNDIDALEVSSKKEAFANSLMAG
jgi:hypothetical protein